MQTRDVIKALFGDSKKFFKAQKDDHSTINARNHWARFIGAVLGIAFGIYFLILLLGLVLLADPATAVMFIGLPIMFGLTWVLSIAMTYVAGAFLHIWLLIFGTKQKYAKSYQLFVYAAMPRVLLSLIPIIGAIIGFVWQIILRIQGLEEMHKFPRGKAVAATLIPVVLNIAMYIIVLMMLLPLLLFVGAY
jgi:hypothetical protein